MSVSTCAEIEKCPRRWALNVAEYPELWSGRGYPPKLQVSALAGIVVHLALEIIIKRLMRAGVCQLSNPCAIQVLRELGGYTRVIEECVEHILKRYVDNPRAVALMEHAQRSLRGQVPKLRSRVQSMLSRFRLPNNTFSEPVASNSKSGGLSQRRPLVSGVYSEVELCAKSIGWKGKVDLLVLSNETCEITDFKTGKFDEAHEFQIRAYAVMWRLDDELNPSGRIVDRLVLAYESQDVEVAAPSSLEIDEQCRELLVRRQAAEAELATHPPAAHPNTERCRYCGVRQLCDAYWTSASLVVTEDKRFGDIELKITGRHGPTSWDAVVVHGCNLPPKKPALLRIQEQQCIDLKEGAKVRVLDAAIAHDSEDNTAPAIVSFGLLSEAYYEPLNKEGI